MSNIMPFGRDRKPATQPNKFDSLELNTQYRAAKIKSDADLEALEGYFNSALADQAVNQTADLAERVVERCKRTPEAAPYLVPILEAYAKKNARRIAGWDF